MWHHVTPCDTLTKAEKSYVWTDPSVTGPGEGHLLVPGIVELPSTWGSSMNDSHFNRFQHMSTVNWLSTHFRYFSTSNILPYFALEHIYQTMQKHDSGSMSFLKTSNHDSRPLETTVTDCSQALLLSNRKKGYMAHTALWSFVSDLLSLNKIQVQHHNRGCQGPTTKLFHSKVQNRPSWRPLSACTFFSFHTAPVP